MRLKSDVETIGMRPEILIAIVIANGIYEKHGYECGVSSINDSKHSLTSLHNSGNAVDLQTKHISGTHMKYRVKADIERRLTIDYDVVLEDVGEENEHLHIEYQPRRR